MKHLLNFCLFAAMAGCCGVPCGEHADAEGFVARDGWVCAVTAPSDYYVIRYECPSDVKFVDSDRKALQKWDFIEIRQLKDSVSMIRDGVFKTNLSQRLPGRNWMKWLDAGARNVRIKFVGPDYRIEDDGRVSAPEGFAPLFNGKDLSGWRGMTREDGFFNPSVRAGLSPERRRDLQAKADASMKSHWQVRDGALVFDGLKGGYNIAAEKEYGDFEVVADWRLLRVYGDSGFYLRGLPQVQIWDPNMWGGLGSGGLWNNDVESFCARVCADRPIGDWNRMRMRIVGDVVSVWLNGQLVVDGVRLENARVPGAAVPSRGNFELQCHGDPIEFRNVFIREL